eukprot:scaffold34057_cov160-Skeletonema_menzelii.AAC.2
MDEISTATDTTRKKTKSSYKKKLKPVLIVPSESSVGDQDDEEGGSSTSYLGGPLPQSSPIERQQRKLPQHELNQSHNNTNVTDNSDDDINNNNNMEVFGAWAQIESLKRRVQEAEERARQENRRAEMASYELELVRDNNRSTPTISNIDDGGNIHVGGEIDDNIARGGADSIISSSSISLQNSEVDEWKKRALEAEERLLAQRSYEQQMKAERPPLQQQLLSSQQQQQQHLLSPSQSTTQSSICSTPRGVMEDESSIELIRLKNAEIDVLRSQIHRLERRIQEECDRSENMLSQQRQRHHYHYDGSASSCTGPPSVVGDDIGRDEIRLLRNEIQSLQSQLRRQDTATTNNLTGKRNGNTTSASTTGSTLSSLDENENHYDEGEEEIDDDEDDSGGGGCCSSWGLCCVRRRTRRRGYGRV